MTQETGQETTNTGEEKQGSSEETLLTQEIEGAGAEASSQEPPEKSGEGEQDEGKSEEGEQGQKPDFEYEFPEGVELDGEVMDEFKELAKSNGLDNDAAKKFADLGAKMSQRWASKQADQILEVRNQWADQAKHDSEFGGDKLQESLSVAKKAMDTFGSGELNKLLEETGLGNHPEIIRAFVKAGKAISEDSLVKGSQTKQENVPFKQRAANVLYGNTKV